LIRWFWLLAVLLICMPSPAQERGSEARTAFRVEYVGPDGCSSADALTQKIARRAPRARAASPHEDAVTFHVELDALAGVSGRLRMAEPDGHTTTREVHAANCREASAALTLIAAVLLDPLGVVEDLPSRQAPRAVSAAPAAPTPPRPSQPPPRTTSHAVADWRFGAAVGMSLESAATPRIALTESVEVNALLVRASWLEPLLALSLSRTAPQDVRVPVGDSSFSWFSGRLAACPFALLWLEPLSLRVCGLFDAGELRASAQSSEGARLKIMPWFALGGEARLEWSPVHPLLLTLEGGVTSPLSRGRFLFEPDDSGNTAFAVPAVGGLARFGLGLRF
jgi:hypothetical protein